MVSPSPLFGNWFTPTQTSSDPRGITPQDSINDMVAGQTAWLNSPIGQKWNAAQESAAKRAREVADFEMAQKKRELDARVDELRMSGRRQEADILLRQGDAALARERFAFEQRIKQQELGLSRERLDIERGDQGLRRADLIARYSSSPDMMFMRTDLLNALNRAQQGQGPTPYGSEGSPRMKTSADFEAIAGPGGSLAQGGQPGTDGPDPRVKAARGVLDNLGISEDAGYDDVDRAVLGAIENIVRSPKPGVLQKLRPGQRAAFGAGLSRLGAWAPDVIHSIQSAGIGQGASNRY